MQAAINQQQAIVDELLIAPALSTKGTYDPDQELVLDIPFESLVGRPLINKMGEVVVTGEPTLVSGVEGNGFKMQHYDVVRLPSETGIERLCVFSQYTKYLGLN